jgi:hypothetical protein
MAARGGACLQSGPQIAALTGPAFPLLVKCHEIAQHLPAPGIKIFVYLELLDFHRWLPLGVAFPRPTPNMQLPAL